MKGRKHKGTGGASEAEADVKDKPEDRNAPNRVAKEAEEMKKGGRAKKARGGGMSNRPAKSGFGPEHKTSIGKIGADFPKPNAGRKQRKSGGRTGSDSNPLTSAHRGKNPPGRSEMMENVD